MADLKISQLTGATTPLAGTEVLPVVQSSTTKKVSVANLTAGRAVEMASLNAGSGAAIANTVATLGNNTGAPSKWGLVSLENCGGVTPPSAAGFMVGWNYSNGGGETNIVYGTGVGGAPALVITAYNGTTLTEAGRFSATGNYVPAAAKGVNFTANTPAAGMTSQLLNWYEEGTWTPQYTNTTPPTTPYTMTIFSATYTRIGRQVTVRAYIGTSNVNTAGASGELSISGLPFAPASGNASYSAANVAAVNNWTTYPCFGYVASDSKIYLEKRATSNGTSANMVAGDLVAGATANQNLMMVTATYFT